MSDKTLEEIKEEKMNEWLGDNGDEVNEMDYSAGFDAGVEAERERLDVHKDAKIRGLEDKLERAKRTLQAVINFGLSHYEDCPQLLDEKEDCGCASASLEDYISETLKEIEGRGENISTY